VQRSLLPWVPGPSVKHVPLFSVKHVALVAEVGLAHACRGVAAATSKDALTGRGEPHCARVGAGVGEVVVAVACREEQSTWG
jgi:hypothetical protein